MLTLTAVVGLWAMARPVNLPRRARLAVNATLAMAGAQVHVDYKYIALSHPFFHHPFLFSRFYLGCQPCCIMFQSTWPHCINQVPWLYLPSLCGLDTKLKRTDSYQKFNLGNCNFDTLGWTDDNWTDYNGESLTKKTVIYDTVLKS